MIYNSSLASPPNLFFGLLRNSLYNENDGIDG
jgi:hypothetical protein